MPNRSRKKRTTKKAAKKKVSSDPNEVGAWIVEQATDGDNSAQPEVPMTPDGRNAAAVALGRLGGRKGGPARATKLSAEQRSEIARRAAQARWNKEGRNGST